MSRTGVVVLGLVWAGVFLGVTWWLWTWIGADLYAEFTRAFGEDADFGDKLSPIAGLGLFIATPLMFAFAGVRAAWAALVERDPADA